MQRGEGIGKEARPAPQGHGSDNFRGDNRRPVYVPQQSQPQRPNSSPAQYTPQYPSQSQNQNSNPSSTQPYPKQPPSHTPAPIIPSTPVVDENKIAFAKAAEELKSKVIPSVPTRAPLVDIEYTRGALVGGNKLSLSDLKSDNKKIPSPENMSSLKNALASVLKKPEPIKAVENPRVFTQTEPIQKFEQKPEQKTEKKILEFEAQKKNNEIPEDVLREVLSMDPGSRA